MYCYLKIVSVYVKVGHGAQVAESDLMMGKYLSWDKEKFLMWTLMW